MRGWISGFSVEFFRLNESNFTFCASFSRQWIYDSHSIGYFITILPIVADFT